MVSIPIACPRETTDKCRATTTNSSSSHHHDSAPSRPHSLICTGAEPFHPVHASSQLGCAAVTPQNEVIFLPFWRAYISSKHITNAIATIAQVNDVGFTSKSMRKGGLSTAKRLGVPKALRCQQSGHQSNAPKAYESDDSTDTENNQDLPRCEPPGRFRTNHLYRFS